MRTIVDREAFTRTARAAAAAVKERTPRDILKAVCIECLKREGATAPRLQVRGTDTEVMVSALTYQVDVMEPGAVAVPCEKLLGILGECTDTTVTLETVDGGDAFWVRTERAAYKLWGYPAKDFPSPWRALEAAGAAFTMEAEKLKAALRRCKISRAHKSESRFATSSAWFGSDGSTLELVATDGRSLSLTTHEGVGDGRPGGALVPGIGLDALAQVVQLAMAGELVRFAWDATGAVAVVGEKDGPGEKLGVPRVMLGTVLTEGTFPPYREILPRPEEIATRITVQAEAMVKQLRKVMTFKTLDTASVTLALGADGCLELQGGNLYGASTVRVEAAKVEGAEPGWTFSMPGDYLQEALATCDDLQVVLGIRPGKSKALVMDCERFRLVLAGTNIPPQAERAQREEDRPPTPAAAKAIATAEGRAA